MALTAPKSSGPAGRISTVVPSAKSAYTWLDPSTTCAVLMAVSPVFWPASAAEDDLERADVRGPGEDVVRRFHLIQAEVVGDEPLGVDLAAGDQAHQGRGGGGVLQARGDRDVPDPLFVQVQRDGSAVHADVRDPPTRPGQLDGQLEGGGHTDGLDGHIRAQAPGQVLDDGERVLGDPRVGYLIPGLAPRTVVNEGSHGCLHLLVTFCSLASARAQPRDRAESPFLARLKVMGPGA